MAPDFRLILIFLQAPESWATGPGKKTVVMRLYFLLRCIYPQKKLKIDPAESHLRVFIATLIPEIKFSDLNFVFLVYFNHVIWFHKEPIFRALYFLLIFYLTLIVNNLKFFIFINFTAKIIWPTVEYSSTNQFLS